MGRLEFVNELLTTCIIEIIVLPTLCKGLPASKTVVNILD